MFTKLTTQSALPPTNEAREFPCGDKTVCIANVGGTYSAMDNVCLHRGGPLGQGTIEHGKVVCPWHGAAFDLARGNVTRPPAADGITTYEVRLDGEEIAIAV